MHEPNKMTISYLIIKKLRLRQSQTGSRIIQTDRQTSAVAQGLQMGDRAFGVDNRNPIEDRFGQLTYPQCMVTSTYSHWWIDYIWLNMIKTISFCCTLRLSIVSPTNCACLTRMLMPMVQEKSLPCITHAKFASALATLQMSFLHKCIEDTQLRERVAKPVQLPIRYFCKVQTKKVFAA